MKITIDTKEDSHQEIKKVISLLTHLIGEMPQTNANIFDNSKPTAQDNSLFNIFDNSETSSSTTSTQEKEAEKQEKPAQSETIEFY